MDVASYEGVIMVSIFSDNNNVVRFSTRLHSTLKIHISVFLAAIVAKFVVFIYNFFY